MHLVVFTQEEFTALKHFATTGKRADGCHATDAWIGTMLQKSVQEIDELLDRCDVFFATARQSSEVLSKSRFTVKAWQNGDEHRLMEGLRSLEAALKA